MSESTSSPSQPNSPDQPNSEDAGTAASTVKPPQEWVTGDEAPTGAQLSYLSTLAREAGEQVPENLTKARASELIDQFRQESPRVTEQ